jgi:hypothetical protein
MIGLVIGGAEDFLRLWCQRSHALAAAGAGADQDQAPDEVGRLKGDLLRDKAVDRKAEHIDLPQPQRLMKETALAAICSQEVGTSPEVLETLALLNRTTSRSVARPSVTAGSQRSIVPVKCWLKTTGTPAGLPNRR